jgi:hypothetical protein
MFNHPNQVSWLKETVTDMHHALPTSCDCLKELHLAKGLQETPTQTLEVQVSTGMPGMPDTSECWRSQMPPKDLSLALARPPDAQQLCNQAATIATYQLHNTSLTHKRLDQIPETGSLAAPGRSLTRTHC